MKYQRSTTSGCKDKGVTKLEFVAKTYFLYWNNFTSAEKEWVLGTGGLFCIKGTVSVISSDPQCKDWNAQHTTVSLRALSDQIWIRYQCL